MCTYVQTIIYLCIPVRNARVPLDFRNSRTFVKFSAIPAQFATSGCCCSVPARTCMCARRFPKILIRNGSDAAPDAGGRKFPANEK